MSKFRENGWVFDKTQRHKTQPFPLSKWVILFWLVPSSSMSISVIKLSLVAVRNDFCLAISFITQLHFVYWRCFVYLHVHASVYIFVYVCVHLNIVAAFSFAFFIALESFCCCCCCFLFNVNAVNVFIYVNLVEYFHSKTTMTTMKHSKELCIYILR